MSRHLYRNNKADTGARLDVLRAALANDVTGYLPPTGVIGLTRKLADDGLLRSAGTHDQYPHVLYAITGRGRRTLAAHSV